MSVHQTPWTLRTIVKRSGEILRQQGVKALVFSVLGEIGYRRMLLFELNLAHYREHGEPVPANVRFELLSADNVGDLLGLVQHCDEREAKRRIADGHLCAMGYVDGRPAYSGWLAPSTVCISYLNVTVVPSPGAAYSYEVYVGSSSRGLGLAKLGMDFRVRLLRERGFQKCVSTAVPENKAAVAHTLSRGFRAIGWAYSLGAGRLKRSWLRLSSGPSPLRIAREV